MDLFNRLGIDGSYFIIGILCGILLLFILYVVLLSQHNKLKKLYKKFMEGADGVTLESAMLERFQDVADLKEGSKELKNKTSEISDKLLNAIQKVSIIKYDAFKEMGGKLSFSLCMLDNRDNGFIITSMHNSREGCYTYIKEIINGESYVLLSGEEKQVLSDTKNKNN